MRVGQGHIANVFFLMEKYDDAIRLHKKHLDKVGAKGARG
jgi:hypothetical protein